MFANAKKVTFTMEWFFAIYASHLILKENSSTFLRSGVFHYCLPRFMIIGNSG